MSFFFFLPRILCSLLSALCSLLSALCSQLSALCSLHSALSSLSNRHRIKPFSHAFSTPQLCRVYLNQGIWLTQSESLLMLERNQVSSMSAQTPHLPSTRTHTRTHTHAHAHAQGRTRAELAYVMMKCLEPSYSQLTSIAKLVNKETPARSRRRGHRKG
jgi:hypothetical protein